MLLANNKKTAKAFVSGILAIVLILLSFQSLGVLRPEATTDSAISHRAAGVVRVEDDFSSYDEGGNIHEQNGWISQKRRAYEAGVAYPSHTVTNGTLKAWDDGTNGWGDFITMRSMEDAAVNQRVTVDVLNMDSLYDSYANVHLRYMIVYDYKTAANYRPCLSNNYFVSVDQKSIKIRSRVNAASNFNTGYWWGADTITVIGEKEFEKGAYKFGHEYRIEFMAQGTYPTKLTATLYDITDDMRVVANVYCEDDNEILQAAGTVAISHKWNNEAGREQTIFDNFKYEETAFPLFGFEDEFTGDTISGEWSGPENSNTNVSFDGNNISLQKNDFASEGYDTEKQEYSGNERFEHEAAMIRPMSEAAVNQTVEIKYTMGGDSPKNIEKTGVAVYAHVQDQRPTDDNCYRASVTYAESSKDATETETVNLYVGNTLVKSGTHNHGYTTAEHRLVISTEKVATGIKITVTSYKWEDSTWKSRVTLEYTDTDSDLQGAGTAGFTIYKKWNSTIGKFDYFKYSDSSENSVSTFNALESENNNVIKNKYTVANRTDTFNETAVIGNGSSHQSENKIAQSLNHDGAFIAYAVNVEEAGTYSMRAILKMSGTDATSYAKASKYAMIAVKNTAGVSSYKLDYFAPMGMYASTNEVEVSLTAGTNIIYLYGPTAELTQAATGITIDYDKLYTSSGLTIINGGAFSVAGDANNDQNVDLRDLIRFKRFIQNSDYNDINYDAVGYLLNNYDSESWSNASFETIRSFLLTIGTDDTTFDEKSWLLFEEPRSVNADAIIEDVEGGADAAALTMQNSIVDAASTVTAANSTTGTVYYFSSISGNDSNDGKSPETAKKNPYRLKDMDLKFGDVVLFERGSIFRQGDNISQPDSDYNWQNCLIEAVSGVSYGAYGTGLKPVFNGSARNYAGSTVGWKVYEGNIYVCDLPLQDAGNIWFDDGTVGIKKASIEALAEGNDFYHDVTNKKLYLYCVEGNPSEVFNDIEIGVKRPIIALRGNVNNVKIDNLDIKHCGAHAIDALNDNSYITITNCEVSWSGGSYQEEGDTLRYGNAIQFWGESPDGFVKEISVKNCWIHDNYDAGLTFQGPNNTNYENIYFSKNLIQRCYYSVEFFVKHPENETPGGLIHNVWISDNIMQYAGYGFTYQRDYKEEAAHINADGEIFDSITDLNIRSNTFDISKRYILYWESTTQVPSDNSSGDIMVVGNSYYHSATPKNVAILWGADNLKTASSQSTLEAAVISIDATAVDNGKVTWLIK